MYTRSVVFIKRGALVLLALLLTSCLNRGETMTSTAIYPSKESNTDNLVRFLALGDSYTIGESVSEGERWPVQLADSLAQQGFTLAEPEIIARTGWTTSELKEGIGLADPQGPYHLVTLLIGVNNQYRGLDTAEYRIEFNQLLKMTIAFAGEDRHRVVVVSIPDYGVTPFAASKDPVKISREIDEFNAINREESGKAGVKYVDITPVSRNAPDEPELIAADGLHPSAKMYAEWVKLILPVAKEIIEKPNKH